MHGLYQQNTFKDKFQQNISDTLSERGKVTKYSNSPSSLSIARQLSYGYTSMNKLLKEIQA